MYVFSPCRFVSLIQKDDTNIKSLGFLFMINWMVKMYSYFHLIMKICMKHMIPNPDEVIRPLLICQPADFSKGI